MKIQLKISLVFMAMMVIFCQSLAFGAGASQSSTASSSRSKLSVMVYDRGNMPASYGSPIDNQWTRYINDNFAKPRNIDLTYVAVPRLQDSDKINVMMASKSAPDIIFTYNMPLFYTYATQGGLHDLAPLIGKNAPDLQRIWGEEVLQYGRIQGHQYAIFAQRTGLTRSASLIRKDWLDKIGFKLGTYNGHYAISTDDLFDVLTKFKSQNVNGKGAANIFPWGAYGTLSLAIQSPFVDLRSVFYDKDTLTEEVLATQPEFLWPGAKEGFRYMNKLYNTGLMDPDFALQKDDQTFAARLTTGQVGFWTSSDGRGLANTPPTNYVALLYQNEPNAEVVSVQLINSKTGKPAYRSRYTPTGMTIMVPSFSKVPEQALQYLNWLAVPENDFVLRFGFEGEHYKMVDGVPETIDRDYNTKTRISVADLYNMYNGDPSVERSLATRLKNTADRLTDLVTDYYEIGVENSYTDYTHLQPIESVNKYSGNLSAKADEILVQSLMAKPENFDAVYDRLVAEYLSIGGQEIIDEKTRAYRSR
jgi:putative aldouronate transport system substrate-binding protein